MIYLILCHTIIHLIIRLNCDFKKEFQVLFQYFLFCFPKMSQKENIEIFRFFFSRNVLFHKLLSSFLSFLHFAWIQALADAKKCSEVWVVPGGWKLGWNRSKPGAGLMSWFWKESKKTLGHHAMNDLLNIL